MILHHLVSVSREMLTKKLSKIKKAILLLSCKAFLILFIQIEIMDYSLEWAIAVRTACDTSLFFNTCSILEIHSSRVISGKYSF